MWTKEVRLLQNEKSFFTCNLMQTRYLQHGQNEGAIYACIMLTKSIPMVVMKLSVKISSWKKEWEKGKSVSEGK